MKTPHPRPRRPRRLRPRPRLHGHVATSTAAATTSESIAHDPPRARARRDLARHRRHVRAAHQRGAGRPGDRRPPRRGRPGDQVRHRARPRRPHAARDRRRPRLRPQRRATRRCSGSASTTSTSTTSTASTRRRRSRRPSARWPSWSRPARSATSASSEAGAETIRRAHAVHPITALQTRVLAVDARRRGRGAARRSRELGIGLVAYSPLGRGFLTGAITLARRPRGRTTSAATSRASQGENLRRATWRSSTASSELAAERGRHARASSRSPGCCAAGDDVVPIPGTKRVNYLEENVGAPDVELTEEDLSASPRRSPRPPATLRRGGDENVDRCLDPHRTRRRSSTL